MHCNNLSLVLGLGLVRISRRVTVTVTVRVSVLVRVSIRTNWVVNFALYRPVIYTRPDAISQWNGEMSPALFAGGLNHSGCCASVSVPGDCLSLCSGRVVHSSLHAACLPHVHSIVSCLRQALGMCKSFSVMFMPRRPSTRNFGDWQQRRRHHLWISAELKTRM